MKISRPFSIAITSVACWIALPHACAQTSASAPVAAPSPSMSTSMSVTKYDPKRDADADLNAAISEATRDGKHILVKVGGEWCKWCHIMDKFFDNNAALESARRASFVTLKVNYSRDNKNEKFLSRYPKITGYPHLFVLDKNGKLLHSQNTDTLESGESYDVKVMSEFIARWSPKKS